jgi:hypothetical protein
LTQCGHKTRISARFVGEAQILDISR